MSTTKPRRSAKKKRTAKKTARKKTAKKASKKKPTEAKKLKKKIKGSDSGGSLAERRARIRDRYDKPVVVYADDKPADFAWIRFLMLARILGGGIKKGGIIEIAGWEDAGKTSLSIALAGDIQARAPEGKRHVVMVNFEMAEDRAWWGVLGLDTSDENFTMLRPRTLEEGVADAADLLQSGEVCCVIFDSVYAASSRGSAAVMENWQDPSKGIGTGGGIGIEARQWGAAWTAIKGMFVEHDAICIAVNQVRLKIEMGGGGKKKSYGPPPTTTPRGSALRFYAWVRLELTGRVLVDENKKIRTDVDGKTIRVRVIKNKTSGEQRGMAHYDLIRGEGFDLTRELIELSTEAGAISHKGGGNYVIGKKIKVRGKAKLREWVEASEQRRDALRGYVNRWLAKLDDDSLDVEEEDGDE